MASLARAALRPRCPSCTWATIRLGLGLHVQNWRPLQQEQLRTKSKAAREAERNIVVKLRLDVPRFGRKGSYVPIAPAMMRNKWFPFRWADYVPPLEMKRLKAEGVTMARDPEFGVQRALAEVDDEEENLLMPRAPYVRPVEIDMLTPERSMELLTTFIPPTIDFTRQPIEQEKADMGRLRQGASDAADILTAAAMSKRTQSDTTGIYGSVSTADVAVTIRKALAHNDEAARVLLSENDVRFVEGQAEGDATRVKQLGSFKIEIMAPGADRPITRTVRVRAKE
ncbi:hypothetical protein BCR34DRAFT_479722 [Clohesyomyces aquaticus]|uniref:Ribosomal protein L9 domain-containing protein n=1 Tax=Clohesyomyces aquaticus TaxID=1231657 RepID=A0A1Y1ZW19_9PLEO|nr:hypothetical protein BCR34DRAFT_479722 [Clohesyomyces aquaticus]